MQDARPRPGRSSYSTAARLAAVTDVLGECAAGRTLALAQRPRFDFFRDFLSQPRPVAPPAISAHGDSDARTGRPACFSTATGRARIARCPLGGSHDATRWSGQKRSPGRSHRRHRPRRRAEPSRAMNASDSRAGANTLAAARQARFDRARPGTFVVTLSPPSVHAARRPPPAGSSHPHPSPHPAARTASTTTTAPPGRRPRSPPQP
jgi:hypothetical protein